MGLLDSVLGGLAGGGQGGGQGGAGGLLGALLGGGQQGGASPLINIVLGMLGGGQQQGGGGGGLQQLIEQFQQQGLGEQVQSWIGTGQNLPISPDQLQNVLGSDKLGAIAQQLGLSPQDASSQVAGVLPEVIDKLTPGGQLPSGGLGDIGSMLQALMAKRG